MAQKIDNGQEAAASAVKITRGNSESKNRTYFSPEAQTNATERTHNQTNPSNGLSRINASE